MRREEAFRDRSGTEAWASGPVTPVQSAVLRRFEQASPARAWWQLVNSLLPYLALLVTMALTVRRGLPWWTTLALAVPAAGFMVRLFIVMHDCVHASFLPSRRAERMIGRVLGVLVFTPFRDWGQAHLLHHATAGDLDRRGSGDVWTLTVDEYAASSRARRWGYRIVRNPLFMLLFGPFVVFLAWNRIPPRHAGRERVLSVLGTDVAIVAIAVAAALTIGLRAYLLIQLPVLFLAGAWGIWLFYVQHQFEPSYWSRDDAWSPLAAALEGSSYYKLPRLLQWFSGNIGLHHVHHLRPRIPNYSLQRCLDEIPQLQRVAPLTLLASLRCARLALWDDRARRLVSFRSLRLRRDPVERLGVASRVDVASSGRGPEGGATRQVRVSSPRGPGPQPR